MKDLQMTRRQLGLAASGLAASILIGTRTAGAEGEVAFSAGSDKPNFKAPPQTCDCHFHIYNSKFPAAANASLVPPDASVADYLRLRQRLGFERSVIVQPSTYGTDNSCLLSAMAEFGGNVRGIAVVDTSVTDQELRRLDQLGVRGIRFNLGRAGATTIDMVAPLSERVAAFGWHIQLHMKGDDIASNAGLLAGLPTVIVFDHLGRIPQPAGIDHPGFKVVRDLIASGKAYTKISSPYPGHHKRAALLRRCRPSRQGISPGGSRARALGIRLASPLAGQARNSERCSTDGSRHGMGRGRSDNP